MTLPDLWPADAAWNVPGDISLWPLAVGVVLGLVWFAVKTRKGR